MIGISRLGDNLIREANQSRYYIDRLVQGDQDFHSWKSANKICVDFRRSADDKIGMNLLITIGRPFPNITSTRLSNCYIRDLVRSISPWHGTIKSESENLRRNTNFKNAELKNNFQVEKLGAKIL